MVTQGWPKKTSWEHLLGDHHRHLFLTIFWYLWDVSRGCLEDVGNWHPRDIFNSGLNLYHQNSNSLFSMNIWYYCSSLGDGMAGSMRDLYPTGLRFKSSADLFFSSFFPILIILCTFWNFLFKKLNNLSKYPLFPWTNNNRVFW